MKTAQKLVKHTISDHRMTSARHIESPNYNHRPDPEDIDLIVVHGISLPIGQFGGGFIEQLFTNTLDVSVHSDFLKLNLDQAFVSSHLLIDREGGLTQFVPFNQRAWHAGASEFNGRNDCNDYSIGIELEGTDNVAYTEAQYQQLAAVCFSLMTVYPEITRDRIVGHCDVAPERKSDPGSAFDWTKMHIFLKES